jgi:hypothetical protein
VEEVYHNSFLKNAWGSEEIPYWFPLHRNEEFNITFQSDDQGFKVQGTELWRYAVSTKVQQRVYLAYWTVQYTELYSILNCTAYWTVQHIELYCILNCTAYWTVQHIELYCILNCTAYWTVQHIELYSILNCTAYWTHGIPATIRSRIFCHPVCCQNT